MSNTVISVEDLSKSYQLGTIGTGTFYNDLKVWWAKTRGQPNPLAKIGEMDHGNRNGETLWALKNISFTVQQGDSLGIIGRNGAGKSTLLKILSRVTAPTSGVVKVKGRIASLLEVGTGFHPELTGRENIYLNGAILGMSRAEVTRKFDEIVDFSGVEQFIDTPVKRYSSGMYVRLAFAVAAHLEPEILIVDEVLAVGDLDFQNKCLGKMRNVADEGRTVLFVSHNMQAVKFLTKNCVLLDKGTIDAIGSSEEVVAQYYESMNHVSNVPNISERIAKLPQDPVFKLHSFCVVQNGQLTTEIKNGEVTEIQVIYEVFKETYGLHIFFLISSEGGLIFESIHNGDADDIPIVKSGIYKSTAYIPENFLAPIQYELEIKAGIHNVRNLIPDHISVILNVLSTGVVNRAYSGYKTPGKISPLIKWETIKTNN